MTRLPPERRRFGMVFQHYALFPHMTVGRERRLRPRRPGAPPADASARVAEMLAADGPRGLREAPRDGDLRRPAAARGARPRARARRRGCCCSTSRSRTSTRRCARRRAGSSSARSARIGITTLFVTHEQEEAFELGDRVAVLNAGRLEQVGTPEELFEQPATRFVATFIGRSSVIPVRWEMGARIPKGPVWPAIAGASLGRRAPRWTSSCGRRPSRSRRGRAPTRSRARSSSGATRGARPTSASRRRRPARSRSSRRRTPPREGDRVLVVPSPAGRCRASSRETA